MPTPSFLEERSNPMEHQSDEYLQMLLGEGADLRDTHCIPAYLSSGVIFIYLCYTHYDKEHLAGVEHTST